MAEATQQTCYRHPDRRAGVRCQRCGRVICPSCMNQAAVGFHCPECTRSGAQKVIPARALRTQPIVTKVLIGINVAVFLLGLTRGGTFGTGTNELIVDGGLIARAFVPGEGAIGVDAGEWYRLVTSGFLHSGVMHLAFNMLILWLLGSQLERLMGPLRFTILYLASLLAGSFGALLADPAALTVGASGAVFGLMGAAVVAQRTRGVNIWQSGIAGLIVINLIITFAVPNISIGGHLGGLIGGLLVGWVLLDLPRRIGQAWLAIALAVLLGAAFFAGGIWAASLWENPIF